jgi:FtsZ-binding cell division protein ZapB
MAGLAPALCGFAQSAVGTGEPELRDALSKWVDTKRLISQEQQEWRVGRELLTERQVLVQREIDSLRERTAQARADSTEADKKADELKAQNAELLAATAGLGATIAQLEGRVKALLARSPAPIVERVKPLSQRIPANPANTKLALSERFQNIIGILNEMNKFGREVTVVSEVRELPDKSSAEVSVLYLGLAQAYYCNVKSGLAGIGRPAPDGWKWEARNDCAQAIADALAVYRNERPADYIALPFDVE